MSETHRVPKSSRPQIGQSSEGLLCNFDSQYWVYLGFFLMWTTFKVLEVCYNIAPVV